ncbi:MAG: ATP-binding protein, partial [Opitutus sp.]
AFDAGELRRLAGSREDSGTPVYAAVKQKLRRLRAVQPGVRFVYIFRAGPEADRVIFLADSAEPGAMDESLPGDVYTQALQSPGLQTVMRSGEPSTEGPLEDDFGTWVTGYALIGEDGPVGADAGPREFLGLDIDAARWRRALLQAGFQGAFYAWVMLGLPFLALIVSRRQGEQREVIRNLSEAMEQSHSAIMILDLDRRIEFANSGLCRQIGHARRELIGREWREFWVSQPGQDNFNDTVATIRAGHTWEGEWVHRRKDGSTYPVHGVVTPVRHRGGSLACFVAVFDDVSDAKRKEAELLDARDQAEAGDRAKGQFLATMSHEVRTPLNGIVGFTSLLMETPLTSEQREYVQTIRLSTEALIHLTGDILDFARIESGKLKLELVPSDPRECLEEALELLAARADEKRVELLHHVADDVPAAILVDGGRLRQVLVNLIGNAVKFTERGEVATSIDVSTDPGLPGAPFGRCVLRFTVRDTGIGIAADHHGRLFKPFSQVDDTTTRRYGGTGLGLAISRNLVRMMGGEITVTSEEGAGSTFTFTIMAEVAAPSAPAERDLGGMAVALVVRHGLLQAELAALLRRWHASVLEARAPEDLERMKWEAALVEVDDSFARELAARPEPLAWVDQARAIALVPVTLSSESRLALRRHFHALVNKPVRHEALFTLLAGAHTSEPAAQSFTRYGYRVLVVEDIPMNQRLIERMLTTLGCSATVVGDGRKAMQEMTARADGYDLVLLDLHMPEMDGMSVLTEIRAGKAGERAQAMWIVAVTADARPEQRERAMEAGINDYVVKPVRLSDLDTVFHRFRADQATRRS